MPLVIYIAIRKQLKESPLAFRGAVKWESIFFISGQFLSQEEMEVF